MDKPKSQELRTMHATLCQAIADPTRIAILYELGDGPKHVNQLVEALALPQATVSRHLKILRDRYLVSTDRDGAYIFYSLLYPEVLKALDLMRQVMQATLLQQGDLLKATYFDQEGELSDGLK
jgi:ArsR family transcriptional regulator